MFLCSVQTKIEEARGGDWGGVAERERHLRDVARRKHSG